MTMHAYSWRPDFKQYPSTKVFDSFYPRILEDGQWFPLYEFEDYEGISHQILAEELDLTDYEE